MQIWVASRSLSQASLHLPRVDPWPSCLGLQIAREIPADAAKYQEWLAAQRESAEEWEISYEDFLSVKPGNKVTNDVPDFMLEQLPSSFTPLNEECLD